MKTGIQFALLTALISGIAIFSNGLFVSQLKPQGDLLDPVTYTTIKNAIVALVLSLIITTPNATKQLKKLTRIEWSKLTAIGIIGGSIPFALFFTGLAQATAPGAAIIHKTLFVWVAFLALFFLKERLTFKQILAYILVLGGALWLSGPERLLVWGRGELMILAATMFWAIENIIAKRTLTTVSPQIVAWARMAIGSVILIAFVIASGRMQQLSTLTLLQTQQIIVASTLLLGYVLTWYTALSKAPATIISLVLTLSTVVTAALSAGITKQQLPSGNNLISYMLIGVGVFVATRIALSLKEKLSPVQSSS